MDRNKRALIRLDGVHELQQIGARIAFNVELDPPLHRPQVGCDVVHVRCRDVACIRTRMDGDPRCARVDAHLHRLEDGRHGSAA